MSYIPDGCLLQNVNGSRSQRVIVFYLGQMLEDFIRLSFGVTCMLQLRLMSQHLPGARGLHKDIKLTSSVDFCCVPLLRLDVRLDAHFLLGSFLCTSLPGCFLLFSSSPGSKSSLGSGSSRNVAAAHWACTLSGRSNVSVILLVLKRSG